MVKSDKNKDKIASNNPEGKRKIGIPIIGEGPWGTHFCQFYQTKEDLIDVLVPYFQTGLENNEFCMWITSEPLNVEEAKKALQKSMGNIDEYYRKGQIEILDASEWYTKSGRFNADEVLAGWVEKEKNALKQGFDGLRLSGNTFWLEKKDWKDFTKYEETINDVIKNYKMLAICSYSLDKCSSSEIIDVVSNHQFTLIKREGRWHRIENPELKKAEDSIKIQRELFETVVNSIPAAINLIRGRDLTIQLINPAYQAIAPGKHMIGKTLNELWPETGKNFAKLCQEVLDSGKSYHVNDELNMIRRQPDGPIEPAYFSWSLYRIRLPGDEGWGILNTAWETTKRKKEEEERLRNMKIFDQIQDGIVIADSNFRITYWNNGAEKMFGYSESEVIGKTSFDILQPSYAPGEREKIIEELKHIGTSKSLIHTKHHNGTSIFAEISATRLTDESGKISGYVVTYRDFTEILKTQKALQEAEIKYRTIADNTYDFEFWINPEDQYLYASPSCLRITGYNPQDFLRDSSLRHCLVHPDDKKKHQHHIQNEKTGKKIEEIEFRIIRKDGKERWIHHVCQPIYNNDGTYLGIRGSNRDITNRKFIEEAFLESKKRLDFALNVSHIGAWDLDLIDHTAFRSLEHDKIFGYGKLLPVWTYEMFLEHIIPEDRSMVNDKFKHAIDSKSDWNFECRIRRTDGAIRWIWAAGRHKLENDGSARRMAGIVQDVTERKEQDQELRRKQIELQTLFDNSPAGLVLFDAVPPYKVLVHNKYYQELFAEPYRSKGMVGLNIRQYAPEVEASGVELVFNEVVQTKQSKSFLDFHYNSNPPNEFWFNWHLSPIIIDNKVVALVSMSLNVTDQHNAEEQLRETHDYLENLLNYANAPIIVWDNNFKITRFNHAFEHLTGYTSEEILGKNLDVLFPPETKNQSLIEIKRTLSGINWDSVEIPILQKNGQIRIALWNSANIYDASGKKLLATIAQGLDITERKQAEEQLRETRDYLDNLLNYANAPIIVWDKDSKIVRFNHAFEHLTGFQSEDMIGKKLDILFPKENRKDTIQKIHRTLSGEYWESVEIPIQCKDKKIRTALWNSANIYDKTKQNLIGTIAQGTDITERKKTQSELLRLASFPQKNPNPIIEMDLSGKIEYLNPISKKLFIDIETKKFNHPFLKGLKNFIPQIQEQKKPFIREIKCDKNYYYQSITYIPENKRIRIYGTDITQRKNAEEELEKSEKKYRMIVENSMYVIMVTQPDGIISYISPSSKDVLGYSPEELIGTNPSIAYPDDEIKVQQTLTRALKGEKGSGFEYRILNKQGEIRWVSHSWSPIFLDGTLQSIISVVVDITERKSSDEKIKKLNENLMRRSIELAIANKELETFSYSVSHDLRAPLRSIDGFSQALLEDYASKLDKQGGEYLQRVRNAAKRMEQLIDDMLRLSRLTRADMTLETVDLGKIANDVINELKKTDPSRNYNFKTQKNIIAQGDKNLLNILLQNLLENAWKFTKKNAQTEIEFGTKQLENETVFFIRDNGAGFNMKYADKLFVPFQRLHDDAEYPGTGIGLGIVARIVHRHGGRIWAEGEEEKGATFFFTLGGKTNE